jgi:hypothetical protein
MLWRIGYLPNKPGGLSLKFNNTSPQPCKCRKVFNDLGCFLFSRLEKRACFVDSSGKPDYGRTTPATAALTISGIGCKGRSFGTLPSGFTVLNRVSC